MTHVVSFVLSLAGSLAAALCLTSRRAATGTGPSPRRLPARAILVLVFLGTAALGRVGEMVDIQGVIPPMRWVDLGLLIAGAGATLWAFQSQYWGRVTSPDGVNSRGKFAMGLLLTDLGVDLSMGRASESAGHVVGGTGSTAFFLGLLPLLLIAAGTVAIALTLRGENVTLAGPGSLLRRIRMLPRFAFSVLGLALAAVVLSALLAPSSGAFLCLMLLALGIGAGVLAVVHKGLAASAERPTLWGIAPRGWVSLVLLAAAGSTLALQGVQLLSFSGSHRWGSAERKDGQDSVAITPVVDNLTTWSLRGPSGHSAESVDPERDRLRSELAETRRKLSMLEEKLSAKAPDANAGPPPPVVTPAPTIPPARATTSLSSVDMDHFRSQKP